MNIYQIKRFSIVLSFIILLFTRNIQHTWVVNTLICLFCISISLPHFIKHRKALRQSYLYCRIVESKCEKLLSFSIWIIIVSITYISLKQFNASLSPMNGYMIIVLLCSSIINHHSSFIYSLRLYQNNIILPGFNQSPIPLEDINTIERHNQKVAISFNSAPEFKTIINNKDLEDFDELKRHWEKLTQSNQP